ncbi:MAG: MBL fold metallo-hydrolase [Pseudomonadota bacterium]
MAVELYNDGQHVCLAFYDLVDEGADHAVQCNQFLIANNGHGALIDPGGNMTYSGLIMAMQRYFPSKDLDLILASHADPDIIASMNKWMVSTSCKVMISSIWARFLPHFTSGRDYTSRIIAIPDAGMHIALGECRLIALPAHFLHSEGNFQFYDPVSKILFSGDMGASMLDHREALHAVSDFDAHVPHMVGFHRRYMVANKVCRYWANMVRTLDIDMIVPQHGARFEGPAMVKRFVDWIEDLPCGTDLMTQASYRVP